MRRRTELITLLVILAVAVFFRFYLIAEIPPGLYPDEAANGNNALEALRAAPPVGGFKIFYPENNGREGLFINLQAIAVKLFGAEPWALRVVSAIFGTLSVLGIYLLAKELVNKEGAAASLIPLLSAFFLAVSYWHINFSRIGFRAVMVPFFAVFGTYWLLKALRTEKISSTILAGVFTGLGFYTYIAFRFMPLVLAVPIIGSLISWRRGGQAQRCVPCAAALFLFVAFVAALPVGIYFLNHPQDFFGRGGQVSIFAASSPLKEFLKSTILTLGMFNIRGDCNARHNLACQPQLFWPVGILFVMGIILAIRNLFQRPLSPAPYTLAAWFLAMMLPATLTREGLPHALRSVGLIPPTMILAAMGGMWLWQVLTGYLKREAAEPQYQRYHRQIQRIKKELAIAALLFLIWIPINSYRDYFARFAYSEDTANAFSADLWRQGQYLNALPDETKKIVIVNLGGDDIRGIPAPAQTIMFATDTFDEERRRQKRLAYVRRPEDAAVDADGKTIIMLMNPRDNALLAILRERFPALRQKSAGDILIFGN